MPGSNSMEGGITVLRHLALSSSGRFVCPLTFTCHIFTSSIVALPPYFPSLLDTADTH